MDGLVRDIAETKKRLNKLQRELDLLYYRNQFVQPLKHAVFESSPPFTRIKMGDTTIKLWDTTQWTPTTYEYVDQCGEIHVGHRTIIEADPEKRGAFKNMHSVCTVPRQRHEVQFVMIETENALIDGPAAFVDKLIRRWYLYYGENGDVVHVPGRVFMLATKKDDFAGEWVRCPSPELVFSNGKSGKRE